MSRYIPILKCEFIFISISDIIMLIECSVNLRICELRAKDFGKNDLYL